MSICLKKTDHFLSMCLVVSDLTTLQSFQLRKVRILLYVFTKKIQPCFWKLSSEHCATYVENGANVNSIEENKPPRFYCSRYKKHDSIVKFLILKHCGGWFLWLNSIEPPCYMYLLSKWSWKHCATFSWKRCEYDFVWGKWVKRTLSSLLGLF